MSIIHHLTARFGKVLSTGLGKNSSSWFGRILNSLDESFNLRYLAERLQHERHAIKTYLGEIHPFEPNQSNLISIICPVYGIKLKFVRELVRSIQRQSYSNWELCLCIDGDTNEKVSHYLKQLSETRSDKFKLTIHSQNRGICAATESALELSCGSILLFADADDILHKDALAAVTTAFNNDLTTDIVYTNNDILTPWSYRIDPMYKPGWSPELLLGCNYVMHLVAVRRRLLEMCDDLWSPKVNGAQDWDMMFRLAPLARQIHHIPIVLYHWRAHKTSSATNAKPWGFDAGIALQEAHISQLDNRLWWDNGDVPSTLRIKKTNCPALHIIEIFTSQINPPKAQKIDAAKYDYSGEVRLQRISLTGSLNESETRLNNLINKLSKRTELILFVCADIDDSSLHGSLVPQAAYAILSGVACVWPFYDKNRGTYTTIDGLLQPKLNRTSYFTPMTGNTLTGPLHGLMISFDVFNALHEFSFTTQSNYSTSLSLQSLGAILGLNAIKKGYRNVAVSGITCHWKPPVMDLGNQIPEGDPYI